jgi:hypothetical protein
MISDVNWYHLLLPNKLRVNKKCMAADFATIELYKCYPKQLNYGRIYNHARICVHMWKKALILDQLCR